MLQKQAAKATKTSVPLISAVESGARSPFTGEKLDTLARLYGLKGFEHRALIRLAIAETGRIHLEVSTPSHARLRAVSALIYAYVKLSDAELSSLGAQALEMEKDNA